VLRNRQNPLTQLYRRNHDADILALPAHSYTQPAPGEPLFKKNLRYRGRSDVVGAVEVMKTFIEIKAETAAPLPVLVEMVPLGAGEAFAELNGLTQANSTLC